MFSIQILKLCRNSVCKPHSISFNDCLNEGKFPYEYKKIKVVPVQKRENKQSVKNHIIVALPVICVIVSFIKKTIFTDNNFISPNQTRFKPGSSIVNQLLATTYDCLMKGLKLERLS